MSSPWIDLSVSVHAGMVHWPGDPEFHVKRIKDFAAGDQLVLSQMDLGVHTGTHMDAPLHFVKGGKTIDQMPLDAVTGEARVIEIHDPESVKREELERAGARAGEILLLKTINSGGAWATDEFQKNFVYISRDAAEYLASVGVKSVGVDYLSVGGFYKDGLETHQALLSAGIWVIEGLNLAPLHAGMWELVCLPLKLTGVEAAPARAMARAIQKGVSA